MIIIIDGNLEEVTVGVRVNTDGGKATYLSHEIIFACVNVADS